MNYDDWPDKGAIRDDVRITIMTEKRTYEVGEEVRVLHVFEATAPGRDVHVMGPKPVHGEHVDGALAGPPSPPGDEPWIPTVYDGAVVPGPAVDHNYAATTYTFAEPGTHEIQWRLGPLQSNVLEIEIVEAGGPA